MTHSMNHELFAPAAQIAVVDVTLDIPMGFRSEDDLDLKMFSHKEMIKRYLSEGWALFQAWSGGKL